MHNLPNFTEIAKFQASRECQEMDPCCHKCTFILNDGTKRSISLNQNQICKYFKELSEEKIIDCNLLNGHFNPNVKIQNNDSRYLPKDINIDDKCIQDAFDSDDVSNFFISGACIKDINYCMHECRIEFRGGRVLEQTLNIEKITKCIEKLPSYKIDTGYVCLSHFFDSQKKPPILQTDLGIK